MNTSLAHSRPGQQVEQLVASLEGIRSARVVMADSRIDEIHVICSPALQPKQVVRNIESALSAGLGIHIDRRIVSVAQLREEVDELQPAAGEEASPAESAPAPIAPVAQSDSARTAEQSAPTPNAAPAGERRFEFVGFDARTQAIGTVCQVSLRRGRRHFEGVGSGPNTPQGRACAAAEALFAAITQATDVAPVGFDGASIVDLSGRPFVLVGAQGGRGRNAAQLTGVAALARSPEEAAILAALQAANRWAEPR
jgi:hypothetical protein